ncbi:DUF2075 domain-containing protein [Thermomonas carbonis]|uniref:DUF2075 domain-containing protein n=1 Tax=Thermomonas carbonis TaxID=1463158 RepID=A0A7G9SRX5_9GAMM|nr:DUF2075 domain-containing protein [Thermomonas carbonis]QNN70600.1 DUF2075 domain-containing protein [Thermomonas carbonis]GHC01044.1 ATPase AAA [Thermomonas carbonis]
MIVYQSTRQRFLEDNDLHAIEELIANQYLAKTGRYAPEGEYRAWRQSLMQMAEVLADDAMPTSMGVGVELGIPQTAKRIDFVLSGTADDGTARVVIIELKQWSSSRVSDHDGLIYANRGGRAEIEGAHPCYQAWSYATLLEGFNEAVHGEGIKLSPCAYLHNYHRDGVIDAPCYTPYVEKAPLFLRGPSERAKLRDFIKRHVRKGDHAAALYRIENGRIRPSKMLADSLVGMLKGNREFVLIDDQKVVYETCLAKSRIATPEKKQVVIVRGGPGTGKSVVAINLIVALTKQGLLSKYISKNAAPRAVYAQKLRGHRRNVEISGMFGGSGAFLDAEANVFDALVVDEAHRLNEKSGLYGNLGENQIKELIASAKCTILFADDDQMVTLADIGHSTDLEKWASRMGADVTHLELASQFRCAGSDGYLAWLDDVLGVRETANPSLDPGGYDFRVVDSPAELDRLIRERNEDNKSRLVAGYCWDWKSKRNPDAYDIVLSESGFRRQWNLGSDGSLWITAPNSIEQVGCIHTCQGLELDYVGVIIGPDFAITNGALTTNPSGRSKMDRSIRGWKTLMKRDPVGTSERLDRIIRNTYRTLMTRGMKGCYVYCTDPAVADFLRQRMRTLDR